MGSKLQGEKRTGNVGGEEVAKEPKKDQRIEKQK